MEACRILGVSGNCDTIQLKKRYRQLLHLVHPDGAAFRQGEEEYPYGIHEIQIAYAVLTGGTADAFCERDILQYIEDFDGSVLGTFTLARGKYLWKPEEEFPLFLQSISGATGTYGDGGRYSGDGGRYSHRY